MAATLTRRVGKLEDAARRAAGRRWRAAVDRMRATMDPEHAGQVADWLRDHVDGKRFGGTCGDPGHVCPRCLDRLEPPTLARAVWVMLVDHLTSGAPVAMPPPVAAVYLSDPQALPANPCAGCGYLLPTQSQIRPDGTYRHIGWYMGECPVCCLDNHPDEAEEAG